MAEKYLNITGLTYYDGRLKALLATKDEVENKVDKVTGKGLSTNDYTTAEQTKLAGIAAGAQVNVIESVKVNGNALTITDKAVDVSVPTVTDTYSGTSSNAMSGKAVKSAIDALDGTITGTPAASKTLTVFSQTDGKVKATFSDISITKSQVSDFPSIPASTSDLTNDSDFVSDANYVHTDNNFTGTLKSKLEGVASGAQVNVIETIKVNNTALTPTSKAVNITVPTKTSEITNDSGFITSSDIPEGAAASTTTPIMDGTAAVGTELAFARGDHVHPTDTSRAAASHTHGNITNAGAITATGVAIANNDALVITDASASGKLVKTSIVFDGSTTSQALTKKGTWGTFLTSHQSLDNYAPKASPALTGTPTAPTANAGTNTTQIATTEFVGTAVSNALAGITGIDYQVVTSLPATGTKGVIYLVAHSHGSGDAYDEYIWTGSAFEKIGNTDVDLSGYWAKADLVAITTSEIDALFA